MIHKIILIQFVCALLLMGCHSKTELQWNPEEGYRWAELNPEWGGKTGFDPRSSFATGVTFTNQLSKEHIAENQNLLNGSGVATGDIDGDGLTDLYFAGLDGPNKLYKNVGGFHFEDITERAGVAHQGYNSTGVVFADVDGDRDLDLLIASMSKENAVYVNDGRGNFEFKRDSGLGAGKGSMTMTLADIDADGDLDLYLANYKERQAKDIFDLKELGLKNIVRRSGDTFEVRPPYDEHFALFRDENGYSHRELGEEDELYLNNGEGVFRRVEDPAQHFLDNDGNRQGLSPDWGLAAKFVDLNNDFLPDLYVCNDYWTPDRVWINQGNGIFKALDDLAIRNFSFYSMAVDFSDIDRDGAIDFFVTEMLSEDHRDRMRQLVPNDPLYRGRAEDQPQYNRNSLYLNRGDTTFAEISYFSGVEATGWSWATSFMDINLDGYEDLLVNTGFSYDMQDLDTQNRLSRMAMRNSEELKEYVLKFPRFELPNKAFLNNGDLTFTDQGGDWGFTEADISHGLALADFDNDGDLDLALNRLNNKAAIFENTTSAPRIAVRLKGKKPNTQGIGAKVELKGGPTVQSKQVGSGGNYLSGSVPPVVFAAGEGNRSHTITVNWPGGEQSIIREVEANRIYVIEEPETGHAPSGGVSVKQRSPYTFEDVSGRIAHAHHENDFEDGRIQDLLPVKLSHLGPGVAWIDFDRDDDDDLFVTSGKAGKLGIFENLGEGRFRERALPHITDETPGDQTAVLGWEAENKTVLFIGSANYEQGTTTVPSGFHYTTGKNEIVEEAEIQGAFSTTGPLAAADYDGDGDLDLFVGGRFIPAHYPRDATSRLFLNEDGTFRNDEVNAELLSDIGMVTGAVFTDYDGDGDQDLLVSRAWGTVALLENTVGEFEDVTRAANLDEYKGWWNGIATGDFNNDGRPDFIAANRGLNTPYQLDTEFPLKMFYGDFDRDNRQEIMEAYYNGTMRAYVPRRSLKDLAGPIPPVTRVIQSHTQFANASLEEIFQTDLDNIPSKEINTLQSMVFLNSGNGFSAHPLPAQAQLSAAFSVLVGDFDSNGNEDVFLSQNLFALPRLTPRQDAGRGLWLRGDGSGRFTPVSGSETGIKIYGEQRGAALSDFNRDGRVDLAVSQNGGATKLYLNRSAETGIRIRLIGPKKNRSGIGSSMRLVYEDGSKGPRREIQAGSGYWSQNSITQVMGTAGNPVKLEITWFDGSREVVEVVPGKTEFMISYED